MTDTMMTRMEALEAVADAAREITRWPDGLVDGGAIVDRDAVAALWRALDTLDALPAAPPGDVVDRECVLWADKFGRIFWSVPGSDDDAAMQGHRIRLGTTRLALTEDGGDAG